MAALNSTVALVPAREYVFVLTHVNAKTGKRGEGGGEAGSKVLGAYGRDVLNEDGKLLLGFARRQQARYSESLFLHPQKWRALHIPMRQLQQGTSTFELYPDKTGEPSIDPLR